MEKRLFEINKRQQEIVAECETLTGDALQKAYDEMSSLENEKQAIETRSKLTSMVASNSIQTSKVEKPVAKEVVMDESSNEYRSAYLKTLQGKELNEVEKRALTTSTSSVGYAVPTTTMNKIVEKLRTSGVVLPLVSVFGFRGNVEIPVEGTTADLSWVAEGSASTDSADTLGHVSLTAKKLIKTIALTAEVEAMTIDAFEEFIVGMLAKKIKIALDNAIINGTGSGQATGILTAITATDASTAGTIDYDDLIDVKKAVKAGYRQNACWMMNTDALADVEKIKDTTKQPIFKAETDERFEGKLLGYPVVLCDNVPDGKIIFGDFSYYYLNIARDFTIDQDKSVGFRSGEVVYRALGLADGNVALDEAFAVLNKGTAGSGS